jgi:hypothetical protein
VRTPSTPEGLPARTAIIIVTRLLIAAAALWSFIVTENVIAIVVLALALVIGGAYAFMYRHGLKPMWWPCRHSFRAGFGLSTVRSIPS